MTTKTQITEFKVGDRIRNTVTGHEGVVISVTAPNYSLMHARTTITARMDNGSHNEWKRGGKSNAVHV